MKHQKDIYIVRELKFKVASILFILKGEIKMKKYLLGVSLFLVIGLLGIQINHHKQMKEIGTVTEEKVISAKYEDGFIVLEVESERKNYSSIERYDISLVKRKYIEAENSYVKKYFNGYGKLIEIELFYNSEIL